MDHLSFTLVRELERAGARALSVPVAFPMEVGRYLEQKPWVISHKPIAVAAGLGHMGIHRSVIHPRFGSHFVLDTVLTDATVSEESRPLDYNPCLECKLCVAVCPTGAIHPDGYFDFAACYTHNYREMLGGFADWVERIVESKDAKAYRHQVSPGETVSMWQSLAYAPDYKSGYCVAVCPAGDDIIGPYLTDRAGYQEEVLRPLQQKEELVYVTPGSDAEAYTPRRFPHKPLRRVGNNMRMLNTVDAFVRYSPFVFQRRQGKDLDVTYHFTFTGAETATATVRIHQGVLEAERGHSGRPDLHVTADTATWFAIVAGERSAPWALMRRKLRLRGPLRLLKTFQRCVRPG
jgi:ferredoxin